MTLLEHRTAMTLQVAVTFRIATAEDLPRLEWYGQYRHFRNLLQRTYREQQAGRRLMLLADVNNFPIGQIFIQLKETTRQRTGRAYFYSFRVMEMFRGQGIGTRLMQEAEAMAAARDISRATIAVAKDNTAARRLYERLGYHIYNEDEGSWSYVNHQGKTCYVSEPCWLLEKYLPMR